MGWFPKFEWCGSSQSNIAFPKWFCKLKTKRFVVSKIIKVTPKECNTKVTQSESGHKRNGNLGS